MVVVVRRAAVAGAGVARCVVAVVVCRKSVNVGMLFAQVRRVVREYQL